MRRTLVRIAHEIVESGGESEALAIGHPSPGRGATLHALLNEMLDETEVPPARSTSPSTATIPAGGPTTRSCTRRTPINTTGAIVIVDDVLYTGRTVRAAIDG
jgi:pyrimidine operon attenuation protein/uracil phosphoribosyltransferase